MIGVKSTEQYYIYELKTKISLELRTGRVGSGNESDLPKNIGSDRVGSSGWVKNFF
jgi:hypothetical protein